MLSRRVGKDRQRDDNRMLDNALLKLRRFQWAEQVLTLKWSHSTKRHPTKLLCTKKPTSLRSTKLRRSQQDRQTCTSVGRAPTHSNTDAVASAPAPTPNALEHIDGDLHGRQRLKIRTLWAPAEVWGSFDNAGATGPNQKSNAFCSLVLPALKAKAGT